MIITNETLVGCLCMLVQIALLCSSPDDGEKTHQNKRSGLRRELYLKKSKRQRHGL